MPLIHSSGDSLLIACGNRILLGGIENSVPIREFNVEGGTGDVISVILSSNGNYLLACYGNKLACCWDIQTGQVLGTCNTFKKPTALATTTLPKISNAEVLLVSDKGGELWAMPIPDLSKRVKLFGHTGSVITDALITTTHSGTQSVILTADRDEKIRLTEFPATFKIESYLLGHRDVITTLSLCPNGYVLSAGWDHQICLWNKEHSSLADSLQSSNHIAEIASSSSPVEPLNDTPLAPPVEESVDPEGIQLNEAENEQDNDENRPFDAAKAGSFPMKVVSSSAPLTISSAPVIPFAVICWESSEIKVYGIENDQFLRQNSTIQSTIITLPEPPVDCVWIPTSPTEQTLVVSLPPPYCVQIFTLRAREQDNSNQMEMEVNRIDSNSYLSVTEVDLRSFRGISLLNDFIRTSGLEYSQFLSFIEIEALGAGIRKHNLDKPFDKMVNIEKKIQNSKRKKTSHSNSEEKDK